MKRRSHRERFFRHGHFGGGCKPSIAGVPAAVLDRLALGLVLNLLRDLEAPVKMKSWKSPQERTKQQMRNRVAKRVAALFATVFLLAGTMVLAAARANSEIPAGTRFIVELSDTLDAKTIKRGTKFQARILESLQTGNGRMYPAGAILKGRVSYADNNKMMLRFEEIDSPNGKRPVIASVVQVMDDLDIQKLPGPEGEIQAVSHRARDAAIAGAVAGGMGAAAGAQQDGGKGAAIGAGTGAAAGALASALNGGKPLVLYEGTRLELRLDRPLLVP
jgi:hypothetical protein